MALNQLKENPLYTKADYEKALLDLCTPVVPYFSEDKALLSLSSYNATNYSDLILNIEAFARILWGLGPFSREKNDNPIVNNFKEGILNGTNPNHPNYWGKIEDFDQRAVEMPSIALFLYFSKGDFWDNLNDIQKDNIQSWLLQINHKKLVDNNWLFFAVLVNISLKKIGGEYCNKTIDNNLARIDEFYLGAGWYSDGETNQRDYYISFAIHFYSLIYSKIMKNDDINRSKEYKNRAELFAKDFIYWFSTDGSAIPFGRSLTYRFAQVAFWSAIIYAEVDVFSLGIVKGVINRNLRWWFKQQIFDNSGLLTVGYAYPNINMSEEYNGSGSAYWALKVFLILALDNQHEYWKVNEEELPPLHSRVIQQHSRMTICRNNSHVAAFVNGQNCEGLVHSAAKYEKMVYSNIFGFSVPRSNNSIRQGAYDSTLSISDDGEVFKPRSGLKYYLNEDKFLYSIWKPWNDVEVETYILPNVPWHIRIHKIKTKRNIILCESGYSIERKSHLNPSISRTINERDNGVGITYGNIHSGILSLIGNGLPEVIYPVANTNLNFPRTELPVLSWKLRKGDYFIVNAVLGDMSFNRKNENYWNDIPKVNVEGNTISVSHHDIAEVINLEKNYKSPPSMYKKVNNLKKENKIIGEIY